MSLLKKVWATLVGHENLPQQMKGHDEINRELAERARELGAINKAQEHARWERVRENARQVPEILHGEEKPEGQEKA